jgi:regulatory ArsR family protein
MKEEDRPLDRGTAAEYASWFKALADPTRIQIVTLLARRARPMNVGEIVAAVDVGQSTCTAPKFVATSDLRVHGAVHAALWYSLITPPSTFRRCTGVLSGTATGSLWSGGRWRRDWCGRWPL